MARSALPQNYFLDPGTLIEDFETVGDWSRHTASGTIEADETNYKTGSRAIRISNVNGATTTSYYKSINLDFSNVQSRGISFWVYCHTDPRTTLAAVSVQMSSLTSGTWNKSVKSVANLIDNEGHIGWNHVYVGPYNWVSYGGENFNSPMRRLLIVLTAATGQSVSVTIDDLRYGVRSAPCIVLSHDHCYRSIFDNAIPIAEEYGARLTVYAVTSTVDTYEFAGLADLVDADASGHTIANHTVNHPDLSALDVAGNLAEIGGATAWLNANGFTRGALHLCYPYNLNSAATHTAMAQLGILTGRAGGSMYNSVMNYHYALPSYAIGTDDTLDEVKAWIDIGRRGGYSMNLHSHRIVESPKTTDDWSITEYEGLLKYIQESRLPCLTIDEWYNGLTNPRYRSLPVGRSPL